MQKINRIGEINKNSYGSVMTIIEYKNNKEIIVEFDNGFIKKCGYRVFKEGKLISPYCKTICSIGYIGEGKYPQSNKKGKTPQYHHWFAMIQRCYNNKRLEKFPSYKGCSVCEEWHNFQNFAKWFDENYYEINGEQMALDKDILYKGNKIYSPQTCIFVPQRINNLFTKNNNKRGDYPIGVSWDKSKNKFISLCHIYNSSTHKSTTVTIGRYDTSKEAFYAYKEFKENYIKQVADEYKPYIPQKLYNAMYRYEVEITD